MRIFSMTSVLCLMFGVSVFAQTLESEFEPAEENQQVNLNLSVQESFVSSPNLDLGKQANPQERYERFTRMKKAGTGLIVGGAVFGTTAVTMSVVRLIQADNYVLYYSGAYAYFSTDEDKRKYEESEAKALGWLVGSYLGYSAMFAGIPIRVVGRVKANQWKGKIPTAYIVPNGVNMVWNF